MVDAFDLRVLGEEIDNLQRVLYMAFNAQRERFKTLQEQKCVQRSERCAGITQEDCTDLRDKGCRADVLCEADAVIAGVRLYEGRELAAAFPVKLTAVYDNAADRRAVTADELCSGMDNNVCAVLERTEEVRRCECGVYNKRNLMCMCNGCDLFNVNQRCVRVTDGLDEDGLCLIVNRVFKSALFIRVYERCGDAVLRERVLEQIVGAAVDGLRGNDVVTCACEVEKRIVDGCCTGSDAKCRYAALQGCNALLKCVHGGVRQTAVDVACICEREAGCCVCGVLEDEGSRLIDRHCAGIGGGVRVLLTCVQLDGFKMVVVIICIAHGNTSFIISEFNFCFNGF